MKPMKPITSEKDKFRTTIAFDSEYKEMILNTMKEQGLDSVKSAVQLLLTGKTVVDTSIPENCKACLKFGKLVKNGKVLCLTKKTLAEPMRFQWIPLDVAQGCSEMLFNTPINKKTREQFEKDLANITRMRDHYVTQVQNLRPKAELLLETQKRLEQTAKELYNIKKPHEELLNEKGTLELKVSGMGNALLERDGKIAVLETDNEQLRIQVTKMSENELVKENSEFLKENDGLRIEITDLKNKLVDHANEIEKIEALGEKNIKDLMEVISKTNSVFRDFKQYLPASYAPHDIDEYRKAMQTKMNQFEGYLVTMNPTRKFQKEP